MANIRLTEPTRRAEPGGEVSLAAEVGNNGTTGVEDEASVAGVVSRVVAHLEQVPACPRFLVLRGSTRS
jgi:hypothetical protein